MRTMVLSAFFFLAAIAMASEPAEVVVVPRSGQAVALSPDVLGRIPVLEATATAHGVTSRYSGYDLRAVLAAAGVTTESLRGVQLGTYVVVTAADGYEAVFSMAELDGSLGDTLVLLADRQDGEALPSTDGPWRLVVPGDGRPARWVRQVRSIRVETVSEPG